ncbi:MAG: T9SS C-terminal target domain-containing protein [Ignavibacteriales bacterium]|nr:MAG: T9SS C-terminal target domain-containing protein [Ignavibacteriales bacterium]
MIKEFIFIILILFAVSNSAQTKKLRFDKITTADGLSSNHIAFIFQDNRGFLWICTQDGINRYDGYRFKHYKHIPGNINSISDYAANHIMEDSKGIFWISTREGLNKFDPASEDFIHYKPQPNDSASLSNEKIVCTAEDRFGNIWVGTRNGLNLFNPGTNSFTPFQRNLSDKKSISYNYITVIMNDSKGNLWVGTQIGLNKFNYETKTFEVFKSETSTGTENEISSSDMDFNLLQNYPNPFNPATKIKFTIPASGNIVIKVFDALGNEIKTLADEYKPAGTYEINFNGEGLTSGIYIYQLTTGYYSKTFKMLLLK